ncbi:MAG: aldehyde dehydrogenase family protein, partial [Pseudomonadota bacterium]
MLDLESYLEGRWIAPGSAAREIRSAVTGAPVARAGGSALDTAAVLDFARDVGGPALRAMNFHQRAKMLKAMAQYLESEKEALYALNPMTGATRKDGWIDIDGGIGTVFVFASKGRREMAEGHVHLDGGTEQLSRQGTFLGQHVAVPLRGIAIQINAFNFPVWGMLEKLAPALLAGMPCVVKPATATAYLAEAAVRLILKSEILPKGALQLILGSTGDLLDRLGPQDVVSFTGSEGTALGLRAQASLGGARFIAEQDSLNASILGPDAEPGSPEFDLFIHEAVREITTKAGQKCTAIRRLIVPEAATGAVERALSAKLAKVSIGNPEVAGVTMGALVSTAQRADVLDKVGLIEQEATRITGDPERFVCEGADAQAGAFLPPMLFRCDAPDSAIH